MTHSDYHFPNHIAPLLSEVVASAVGNVKTKCSNNKFCIFDYMQTLDPEIGKGTVDSLTKNAQDIIIASKDISKSMDSIYVQQHTITRPKFFP